jgi:hypothetical protein
MPFKSKQQRKWMWATHPEMAKKWERHTPKGKKLPKKVKKKSENIIDLIYKLAEIFKNKVLDD